MLKLTYSAWASLIFGTVSAVAQPFALVQANFQPSDTVIDFSAVSDAAPVGTTYSANGVTFSGALIGLTNQGDTDTFPGNGGGVVASNWNYDKGGSLGQYFIASFSTPKTRVGFFLEELPSQTSVVTIYNGAMSLGSLKLERISDFSAEFRGVGSLLPFTSMMFTNLADKNGFYAVDDFTFGSSAAPETSTWVMILFGFAGLGFAGNRTSRCRAI